MKFKIETEQESDGRWIAEIHDLPGTMKYGRTCEEAIMHTQVLALRVIADRIEQKGKPIKSFSLAW